MFRALALSAIGLLTACHAAPPPRHASAVEPEPASAPPTSILPRHEQASARQLIETRGTLLEAYKHTGGEWLPSAPVLLNEDFDFATAMALPDMGAALAAGKRLENNREKVRVLADAALSPATYALLDQRRSAGMNVWFVLWGSEQAKLVLVADVFTADATAPVSHLEITGSERALTAFTASGALDAEVQVLLAQIAEVAHGT